jgi:hypothetical protein
VSERLGAIRLSEVMRQRDPAERLALAGCTTATHRGGSSGRRARDASRSSPTARCARAGDREWAAGVAEHGLVQSVMISRDNETRRALNELARSERREWARSARSSPTAR